MKLDEGTMMEPRVLTKETKANAVKIVEASIAKANKKLNLNVKMIEVRFDLKSKKNCGMFMHRHGRSWLRFHPVYLFENEEDYLNDTIQHEVAHYIDFCMREIERKKPDYKKRKTGHGPTWRRIMKEVFKIDPKKSRFHRYDTTSIETYSTRKKRTPMSKIDRLAAHVAHYTRNWDDDMKEKFRQQLQSIL